MGEGYRVEVLWRGMSSDRIFLSTQSGGYKAQLEK